MERVNDIFIDDRQRRRLLILENKVKHLTKKNEELRRRLGDFDDVDGNDEAPDHFDDVEKTAAELDDEDPVLPPDERD